MFPGVLDIYRSYSLPNTIVDQAQYLPLESDAESNSEFKILEREVKELSVPAYHDDQCEYSSTEAWHPISRIQMGKRIQQMAREKEIRVIIPEERLVADRIDCILSKPISNAPSLQESVNTIISMSTPDKIKLAENLALLIKSIGLVEADLENIRIGEDRTIFIMNIDPHGLFSREGRPESVEKCARIGLYTLFRSIKGIHHKFIANNEIASGFYALLNTMNDIFSNVVDRTVEGLQPFADTIYGEYQKSITPVARNSSIGIFQPLINLSCATFKHMKINL